MCHSSLIWQNRLQSKTNEKRSRRTHHSNQGKNSPRWHYYCKYIPNSGTLNFIFKENVLLDVMIHNDRDLWLVVDFNDPLSLNGTLCTKIKQKKQQKCLAICQMYSTLFHASTQRGFSAAYMTDLHWTHKDCRIKQDSTSTLRCGSRHSVPRLTKSYLKFIHACKGENQLSTMK